MRNIAPSAIARDHGNTLPLLPGGAIIIELFVSPVEILLRTMALAVYVLHPDAACMCVCIQSAQMCLCL